MIQASVLVVYKFPEDDEETTMSYMTDELTVAKKDAGLFHQMYPEVLYVQVIYVHADGREDNLLQWNNPQMDRLLKAANSAGGAWTSGFPMTGAFAPIAGTGSPKPSSKRTSWQPGARPPSAQEYESPSPSASKTYAGRQSRTLRSRGKRR